ncbi:MAG: hypothetical protein KKE62_16495 [Proteobacteria bacterium]|nr:hypothetical protein [Pseudomonadota bacterium]MBU1389566.1 hypothetical protein [Pseudomonadota bacterium]MBU1544430.1 hypothetical protein [Pseudomonadota bacterium]MBU2430730.1 hypothetical protein [Pseudomonadota bacterium]MBU2480704.1 hypothetical protein [Pseudomonadota bacterium]
MVQENNDPLTPQKLAGDLATFAIDRNDLKQLLAVVPKGSSLNLTTLEYELQILKILSVGWAISFFMPASDVNKAPVTHTFWELIREIANNISTLTQATAGTRLDYFDILKTRLDIYVKTMQDAPQDIQNPVNVMGPAFADLCSAKNDAVAILLGTKMFTLTMGAVKEYLNAVKLKDTKLN